jgi:hypothetical protein
MVTRNGQRHDARRSGFLAVRTERRQWAFSRILSCMESSTRIARFSRSDVSVHSVSGARRPFAELLSLESDLRSVEPESLRRNVTVLARIFTDVAAVQSHLSGLFSNFTVSHNFDFFDK